MTGLKAALGCAMAMCVILAGCSGSSPTATRSPSATPIPTIAPTLDSTVTADPTPGVGTTSAPTPTPGAPSPTSVIVSLVSPVTQVAPGQEISVDVSLDPRGRGISGVEMNLEFDPDSFEVVQVQPGPLLGDKPSEVAAVLPRVEIDNSLGVILYFDARIGDTFPPTPAEIVATVKLKVVEGAPAGARAYLRITSVKMPDEKIQEISDVAIGEELRFQIVG